MRCWSTFWSAGSCWLWCGVCLIGAAGLHDKRCFILVIYCFVWLGLATFALFAPLTHSCNSSQSQSYLYHSSLQKISFNNGWQTFHVPYHLLYWTHSASRLSCHLTFYPNLNSSCWTCCYYDSYFEDTHWQNFDGCLLQMCAIPSVLRVCFFDTIWYGLRDRSFVRMIWTFVGFGCWTLRGTCWNWLMWPAGFWWVLEVRMGRGLFYILAFKFDF